MLADVVSTRVSDDMARDLEEIELEEKTDRASVVRRLLSRAIAEWKLERALALYRDGKVTLWRAAKVAGLSLWEMVEVVGERKIPFRYAVEDFRRDFEGALKGKQC